MDADQGSRGAASAEGPLEAEELRRIDAYWRAANYLSVGQIYLLDNPLLRGGFDAKCDRCGGEVRVARPDRPGAPRRPRAACGSRGSGAACR